MLSSHAHNLQFLSVGRAEAAHAVSQHAPRACRYIRYSKTFGTNGDIRVEIVAERLMPYVVL